MKTSFIILSLLISQFLFSQRIEKYTGNIKLLKLSEIQCNLTVIIKNITNSDSLQLLINKNAKISSMEINNKKVSYREVAVKNDLPDIKKIIIKDYFPQDIHLRICYTYPITKVENKTFLYNKHWIEMNNFTAWFPFNRENTSFKYQLKFHIPSTYQLGSTGKIRREGNLWTISSQNYAEDIPVVISDTFNILETKNHKVKFYTVSLTDHQRKQILTDSENILNFYTDLFGSSADNDLTVAINPFSHPWSYTRRGFISLSLKNAYAQNDKLRLAHEIAHLWWNNNKIYGNGNDWLNEGFAEYSSIIFYEQFMDKNEFATFLAKYKAAFASKVKITQTRPQDSDFFEITYLKGAYFLYILKEKIGNENMNNFLQKMNESKINNTTDLLQVLHDEYAKFNISDLLNEL